MMNRELFMVIADDDRMVLDAVAINLEMDGKIKIVKADTLAKALTAMRSYYESTGKFVSAVLVDLELPDAQGVDAVTRLLQESPDTAVIAYTGYAEREEEALKQGAIDFVVKGTSRSYGKELIHAIRTAVIKNNVRLCHKDKNDAINRALTKATEVESVLSGDMTPAQLTEKRRSREQALITSACGKPSSIDSARL